MSPRLRLASLNSSLTLLNAHLQHSHHSPVLLVVELPELQRLQAHEMLAESLHSNRRCFPGCNIVDMKAWHDLVRVSHASTFDANSRASCRRTKLPSTTDAYGLGILLEAAYLATLSLYHIAAYLARAFAD